MLKERRKLVLMVRETPLHAGHLRSMTALAEMGAIIAPPVPAFYSRPDSLADMVDHTVGRVLDLFDIDVGAVTRWGETAGRFAAAAFALSKIRTPCLQAKRKCREQPRLRQFVATMPRSLICANGCGSSRQRIGWPWRGTASR